MRETSWTAWGKARQHLRGAAAPWRHGRPLPGFVAAFGSAPAFARGLARLLLRVTEGNEGNEGFIFRCRGVRVFGFPDFRFPYWTSRRPDEARGAVPDGTRGVVARAPALRCWAMESGLTAWRSPRVNWGRGPPLHLLAQRVTLVRVSID